MTSKVNMIAVGGGKGGIGKSVICTNLAIGMALSGQKVVLVDTDFGASNLHALLGINNPLSGFQDLFNGNLNAFNPANIPLKFFLIEVGFPYSASKVNITLCTLEYFLFLLHKHVFNFHKLSLLKCKK